MCRRKIYSKSLFGKRKPFTGSYNNSIKVYGNQYLTDDGTCVRDYLDIDDLLIAHSLALLYLRNNDSQFQIINLCSNCGYSVFEFIKAFEEVVGIKYKIEITPFREGDQKVLIGSNKKAYDILGWKAERSLKETISSTFHNIESLRILKEGFPL